MATPAQRTNTWILDEWYDQAVAGTTGGYQGISKLFVWGENNYGQLGIIDKVNRSSPIQLPGTTWDLDNVAVGERSLFRKTDSTLWSVGSASWGKLGLNAESVDQSSPMQIGTDTTWSSIIDLNNNLVSGALKTDGTLWVWGKNQYGVLGQNQAYGPSAKGKSSPVSIGSGTDWSSASMAYSHCGALKTDGTAWIWGENSNGRLGLNESQPASKSSPVQLPGTWVKIDINSASTGFGWKSTTALWSWGYHGRGTLGQNDTQSKSSPVQIPGSWPSASGKFSSHFRAAAAVKTDGTLWIWGWNNNGGYGGLLGHNNKTNYSSPRQVGSEATWDNVTVTADSGTAYAVKTDGTLWSWGYNGAGQLGHNNKTAYSSPKQIPGTSWSGASAKIAGANSGGLAIKTDGTLWAWGSGSYGQLGQNTPSGTEYSSPRQIPGTTWSKVASRGFGVFAMKTDGTMWAWGRNHYGQLGVNNRTSYSSPVQIPGADWDIIEGGNDHTVGLKLV